MINTSNTLSNTIKYRQNISFGSSSSTKENSEGKSELTEEKYRKDRIKIETASVLIGLGVGVANKVAGANRPIDRGIWAYLNSMIGLGLLFCAKETLNSKEQNAKYEDEFQYSNKLDKVIGSFCVPDIPTEADEDFKKSLYNHDKKEQMAAIKYTALPTALGCLAFTAVTAAICFAKKLPEKWDSIKTAPLAGFFPSYFFSKVAFANKKRAFLDDNNTGK